jgi:aminopeptidase N
MSEYGQPTRARRAAVAALPQLSEGRPVREHLEYLLDDPFPHVRIGVIAALEQFTDRKVPGILRRHLARELDGRVARRAREALRNLSDAGPARHKKLADELESLRNEFAELKTKLSKLEGAGDASDKRRSDGKTAGAAKRAAQVKTKHGAKKTGAVRVSKARKIGRRKGSKKQ